MAPTRICVITETYVPDVNGVANSLRQLIKSLDPEQYLVQIIRTRPRTEWKPEVEEVWCKGVSIPMYPDLQIGLPASNIIKAAWDRFQPDIVFIATEGLLGYSGLKIAKARNLPVLSAFHTNFHRYSSYYGLSIIKTLTLQWLRRFHNKTDLTLVPSQEVADSLKTSGFRNVETLPHGVDCNFFHPKRRSSSLRKEWGAQETDILLLYVGRIAAEKNIPLAIDSYNSLKPNNPNIKLVMVGDGPMREDLNKQYPDIIFTGVKTGEDLARHYASCDLFVFPSLTETFGLVTLEAMASGLPVVAFDMAAAHMHISPGVQGELAEIDNNQMFIKQVNKLIEGDLSSLRINSREKAEQLSWQSIGSQFISHLNNHLQPNDPRNIQKDTTLV